MSPVLCVICALLCVFVWWGGASRFIKYILEAFSAEMYRLFLCFLAFLFSIFGTLSLEAVFRGRNEHQFFSLTESFLWLATRDANSGISYFWCGNRGWRAGDRGLTPAVYAGPVGGPRVGGTEYFRG